MLLHVRKPLGLISSFFFFQIIKFESSNSKKRSNSSLNIEQELDQWVEWKVAEGSGIITPDQPGDSHAVATKSKARGNWRLCKDSSCIYPPDSGVNSYSKIQACGRRSWIYFTRSLKGFTLPHPAPLKNQDVSDGDHLFATQRARNGCKSNEQFAWTRFLTFREQRKRS